MTPISGLKKNRFRVSYSGMERESIQTKTEEECWAEFWDVMTDVLADLYKSGWTPEDHPEREAVAAR